LPTEAANQAAPEMDSALGFRLLAFQMLQAGRWEEAIGLYEQHVSRFPVDRNDTNLQGEVSRAYRELSRAALLEGNFAKAIASLQKAREWSPEESTSYLWEGSVYESLRRPEDALRIYQGSLRQVRNSEDRRAIQDKISGLMTQRLEKALEQKDYPEALRALSDSEPYLDDARRQEVHYQRARIESAMGLADEALVDYGFHLKDTPNARNNPLILDEIASQAGGGADVRSVLQDSKLAMREAGNAAARGADRQALFYTLVAMGDPKLRQTLEPELLRSAQAAGVALSPADVLQDHPSGVAPAISDEQSLVVTEQVRSKLTELYRQGLYEEGLDLVKRVQQVAPREEFAMMEGVFEEMLGHSDEAIALYERVLPAAQQLPIDLTDSARNQLCDLLVRKAIGEYDEDHLRESLELLGQAERISPYRRDIAFNVGCVYLKGREPSQALEAFTRFLSLSAEDSPRKTLTARAVAALKRQVSRSSTVRYDKRGVKVDLVFEKPGSLGQLLSGEKPGASPSAQGFLDQVLLAPYLERSPQGEFRDSRGQKER
jgi:tetratricopeptide (TPR) repeat protein